MTTNPMVSIVMPVYNCKKYIVEAIDSLLRQTYKNFELICVDDGSTDGTIDILRDYKKQDYRIQIVQQRNQYAGVARNNGMKLATGKYLMFLDADDVFEKRMLSYLVKKAERNQADIVHFGHYAFKDNIKKRDMMGISYHCRNVVAPSDLRLEIFQAGGAVPWNNFYRREFVKKTGLQFQSLKTCNDQFFVRMAIIEAERLLFLNKRFVNYRRGNNTQLTSQFCPENDIRFILALYAELQKREKYDFYKDAFEDLVMQIYIVPFLKCRNCVDFYDLCKRIGDSLKAMHISEETSAVVSHSARKFWNSILREDNNEETLFHFQEYMRVAWVSKKSIEYRVGKKILAMLRVRNYN